MNLVQQELCRFPCLRDSVVFTYDWSFYGEGFGLEKVDEIDSDVPACQGFDHR